MLRRWGLRTAELLLFFAVLLGLYFHRPAPLPEEPSRGSAQRFFGAESPLEKGPQSWGLLINGDTEERHVDNVREYMFHLIDDFGVPGLHIAVLCGTCDYNTGNATVAEIREQLRIFAGMLTPEDTLYIYTTGHGDKESTRSQLVLEGGARIDEDQFVEEVMKVRARKIQYFGDQCFSGGFAQSFIERGNRDVVALSASTPNSTCACHLFTPEYLEQYRKGASDRDAFSGAVRHAQAEDPALPAGQYLISGDTAWIREARRSKTVSEDSAQVAVGPAKGEDLPRTAPSFAWKKLNGKGLLSLEDLKGGVVLLDFWATWCPPCRRELKDLVKLHRRHHKENFSVVGVTMEEKPKTVLAVMKKEGIQYPVLATHAEPEGYATPYIPAAFLIDCSGKIVQQYRGQKDPERLEKDVAAVIAHCALPASERMVSQE